MKTLIALFAGCVATAAVAAEPCPEGFFRPAGQADCLDRAFIAVDRETDALYQSIVEKLKSIAPDLAGPRTIKHSFTKGHRAWIVYRRNHCNAVADAIGGSASGASLRNCLYTITKARLDELKALSAAL
jgi:uncharacterized protein YecT (DUF1311 family)